MKYLVPKQRWLTATLAGAVLLSMSAWAGAATTHYTANLTPLNNSGVTGTANLTLSGNTLTVHMSATGLQPNETHAQHIHGPLTGGFAPGDLPPVQATLPTLAKDDGGITGTKDGILEVGEGALAYGAILVPLTTTGTAAGAFPSVGANGMLNYTQTFDLANSSIYNTAKNGIFTNTQPYNEKDLLPLNFREIVIHGLNAPKSIDSVFAGTTFAAGQYDPLLPVAAGVITTAVPEPADLGMMVGGLGLLFGLLWWRRKDALRPEVS